MMIARAADFYGPHADKTSVASILVFQRLAAGKVAFPTLLGQLGRIAVDVRQFLRRHTARFRRGGVEPVPEKQPYEPGRAEQPCPIVDPRGDVQESPAGRDLKPEFFTVGFHRGES